MVNAVRVGLSVLRYRGGVGQWAWAIHRVAGLGVLLFLAIHILDIFVAAFGPGLFNDLLFLYKGPVARVGEILLAFGLLYHGLNGLRITAADFVPRLASLKTATRLFYLQLVIFLALFMPASFFMMYTLPQEPFRANSVIAMGTTVLLLILPAGIVLAAQFAPPAVVPGGDVSAGNYDESFRRIITGATRRRPRSRFEFNMWLFMRISGILLIALALFHMFWLHFVISVESITFTTLVERWNDPSPLISLFWRSYDLALLAFAFTHGVNGARMVVTDYVHSRGWRLLSLAGLAGLWVLLMLAGAFIIFFFKPAAA